MPDILIIDDEKAIRKTLSEILSFEGYKIDEASDGEEGLKRFKDKNYDVVLCDIKMPKIDGIEFLQKAGEANPDIPIIMISGHGNIETAVEAVKTGAYDYISKPPDLNRLLITIRNAMDKSNLVSEAKVLRKRISRGSEMIGSGDAMSRIKDTIAKVAPTDARVLITGENGAGKELVARAIHKASARSESRLVEVNCAAIPEELIESELFGHVRGAFTGASDDRRGKFEEADGGTLFLDEVGDMSARTQSKVLRALQEGRFTRVGGSRAISSDVRVLSATNKTLAEEIRRGAFREDLFFRLAVVPLSVPALRERREDIAPLARHFLTQFSARFGRRPKSVSPAAVDALESYRWPGNVRELKNLVERLMILCAADEIRREDLPAEIRDAELAAPLPADAPLRDAREDFERRYILASLKRHRGNVTRTAEALGVERSNLYRKLKSYGIEVERE